MEKPTRRGFKKKTTKRRDFAEIIALWGRILPDIIRVDLCNFTARKLKSHVTKLGAFDMRYLGMHDQPLM